MVSSEFDRWSSIYCQPWNVQFGVCSSMSNVLSYILNTGRFTWGGVRVSSTAEGDPGLVFWEKYPIVRASLLDDHGKLHQADYNLSDTIGNCDGNFIFQFRGDRLVTTSNPDKFRWGLDVTYAVNGEIENPAVPL